MNEIPETKKGIFMTFKKILHILPQFQPGGGMERVVMNYFNNIDHNQYQFDIIAHKIEDDAYAKQIEEAGGKVYALDPVSLKSIKRNEERFQKILDEGHYNAVHCHMANAAFLYLKIAKMNGIPLRILHSHQDHYADTKLHALRNIPLVAFGKRYANYRVACSQTSGKFLFGSQDYTVIKNGIDFRDFHFDLESRKRYREKLHLNNDELLLGQIGRLVPQKNPLFSIRVLYELQKRHSNARLIFAGDGSLRLDAEQLAKNLNISDKIDFLGNQDDVTELYNALDVLLMPSLYEGVSLSLVESQATGLLSLASDTITDEAFASSYAIPLSLNDGPQGWAQAVLEEMQSGASHNRSKGIAQLRQNGYDAKECTERIEAVYASLLS